MKLSIILSVALFALSAFSLGCASDRNVKARTHVSVGTGGVNVGVSRSGDLPRPGSKKDASDAAEKISE